MEQEDLHKDSSSKRKKVAIIGSGCSGIAALWAMKSTDHEVHLFEAKSRLGGHTDICTFRGPSDQETTIDTEFIVLNTATHPNFIRFLKHLGIETKKAEASFGVTRDVGDWEWSGNSTRAMFAQKWSCLSPKRWRLIFDIFRFNQFAVDLIINEDESIERPSDSLDSAIAVDHEQMSIEEYLDREGYSQIFKDDYLIPLAAMVWSTPPDRCSLHFPALTLIRFLWDHDLLDTISTRPEWLTIPGGTSQYIEAVMRDFPKAQVHLNTKVTAVVPEDKGKFRLEANGQDLLFDDVILATHAHQALDILKFVATKQEQEVLGGFRTNHNIAVLHSDLSLMPQRRIAWSAWNFITESPFPPTGNLNVSKICLTYWMNLLQHIDQDKHGPVLITLNPLHAPATELTRGVWEYSHPLYDSRTIRSQKLLPSIQNRRGISYCGAWTSHGFHDHGFSSGLAAAQDHFGASLRFELVEFNLSRGEKPILRLKHHAARLVAQFIQLWIVVLEVLLERLVSRLDRGSSKAKTA